MILSFITIGVAAGAVWLNDTLDPIKVTYYKDNCGDTFSYTVNTETGETSFQEEETVENRLEYLDCQYQNVFKFFDEFPTRNAITIVTSKRNELQRQLYRINKEEKRIKKEITHKEDVLRFIEINAQLEEKAKSKGKEALQEGIILHDEEGDIPIRFYKKTDNKRIYIERIDEQRSNYDKQTYYTLEEGIPPLEEIGLRKILS